MGVEPGEIGLPAAVAAELGHPDRRDSSVALLHRVLIVEDDAALAENLCEIVNLAGYDAVAVPSAEAALSAILGEPIDFIVTDYHLSGMNGAALLLAVGALGRRIPAVLTTAWMAHGGGETDAVSGGTDIMTKPVDIEALLAVLRRELGPPPAARDRPAAWHHARRNHEHDHGG